MDVPMTPGRIIASLVAIVPLIMLWQLIPQPTKLVHEQKVEATVVTVTRAEMQQRADGSTNTHVAQVELPDGGKARVWLSNGSYSAGDPIELRVRHYDDGHRDVRPAY